MNRQRFGWSTMRPSRWCITDLDAKAFDQCMNANFHLPARLQALVLSHFPNVMRGSIQISLVVG